MQTVGPYIRRLPTVDQKFLKINIEVSPFSKPVLLFNCRCFTIASIQKYAFLEIDSP